MERKYHFLLLLIFSFAFFYSFELPAQNSEVEINSEYVSNLPHITVIAPKKGFNLALGSKVTKLNPPPFPVVQ